MTLDLFAPFSTQRILRTLGLHADQSAAIKILTYVESSMVITAGGVMLIRPTLRL
jgi:hypothetical protein